MNPLAKDPNEHCFGCVYYPPNLPESAYPAEDYRALQQKNCSYDHSPGDAYCQVTRKTSCSVIDLEQLKNTINSGELS